MGTRKEAEPRADLRDYLAAERTFLAWIRTGLALMGFGFVVARFGLFLEQLSIFRQAGPAASSGLSLWFGTALIGVGVVVNASAAWQHTRLVRQLDQGAPPPCRPLGQNVAIALLLALVGLAMAIYLVSVHGSSTTKHSGNSKEAHLALAARPQEYSSIEGVTRFASVDSSGEAEKV
jgi:inner membrane protein YidH